MSPQSSPPSSPSRLWARESSRLLFLLTSRFTVSTKPALRSLRLHFQELAGLMRHLPRIGSSLVALVSFLTLVAARARQEEDRKAHSALKAECNALEKRAAALQARVHLLERNALDLERQKDEFLATLSHELRSPLNAMLGWIEVLARAAPPDPIITRAIATLERNIWTQAQVVSDLLDVSRIASGKIQLDIERVDLPGLVAGVAESLRPSAEAKGL